MSNQSWHTYLRTPCSIKDTFRSKIQMDCIGESNPSKAPCRMNRHVVHLGITDRVPLRRVSGVRQRFRAFTEEWFEYTASVEASRDSHRTRRGRKIDFGSQRHFQCHVNCQGLSENMKPVFYWDSHGLNQISKTFLFDSHYWECHPTKNVNKIFLALIPKKLEFYYMN